MASFNRQITVTHGESMFIATSLEQLRSEVNHAIREHGDDDGNYDAHIRILDKIIPKFQVSAIPTIDWKGK